MYSQGLEEAFFAWAIQLRFAPPEPSALPCCSPTKTLGEEPLR
jgi:hypothetical protein